MKSPINRIGGKYSLTKTLLNLMPPHKVYIEPFFGAGHFFFAKPKVDKEIINDIDNDIYTFFKVLQDPDKAQQLIDFLSLTPYSRKVFNEAKSTDPNSLPDVYQAIRYFILNNQSFASKEDTFGISVTKNLPQAFYNKITLLHPVISRLKNTYIENDDAIHLLNHYIPLALSHNLPTLIFLDPPYQKETCSKSKFYTHESTPELHQNLLQTILTYSNYPNLFFIITHYQSDLYESTLKDFRKIVTTKTISTLIHTSKKATEIIYTNF